MSITITLTFDTPAEAAVALNALHGAPLEAASKAAEYPISSLSGTKPKGKAKAAPVEAAPAEAAPVETAPVEAAPVETAPVEAAPVEAAPVEAAPVEAAPVEAAPVDYDTLAAAVLRLLPKDAAAPKRIATECGHNTFRSMREAGDTAAMVKAYALVCAALGA
jgi:ribonuclease E